MSPNINSFVGDLVAMAQAVEELPKVQDELNRVRSLLDESQGAVQARELAIMAYKQQIEDLNAKVRSLEVERDDASFRVLEAEDREHSILLLARNMQNDLAVVMNRLDPPQPEPEPVIDHAADALAARPFEPSEPVDASGWNHGIELVPQDVASSVETQGTASSEEAPKSDANPPTTVNDGDKKPEQTSVISSANSDATSDKSEDKEPSNKYSVEWYDWDRRQHRF